MACLIASVLAGCTRTAPPLPPTPDPITAVPAFVTLPAAQALPELVQAERSAAGARDLATLRHLWAKDARIIDGRGTPDADDDFVWRGRAAILDRYELAVFPAPPPPFAAAPALTAAIDGDTATAVLGNDTWRFTFRAGRWWLQELAY
jgi:hypothetical protein